jgi:hypothetical protein
MAPATKTARKISAIARRPHRSAREAEKAKRVPPNAAWSTRKRSWRWNTNGIASPSVNNGASRPSNRNTRIASRSVPRKRKRMARQLVLCSRKRSACTISQGDPRMNASSSARFRYALSHWLAWSATRAATAIARPRRIAIGLAW